MRRERQESRRSLHQVLLVTLSAPLAAAVATTTTFNWVKWVLAGLLLQHESLVDASHSVLSTHEADGDGENDDGNRREKLHSSITLRPVLFLIVHEDLYLIVL